MSTCKRMWTDREIRSMADDSAKIRIESGNTENAKPLYYHPITIYASSYAFSFAIIDNNDEAYTKTTILEKIAELERISPISGVSVLDGKYIVGAYSYKSGDNHMLLGFDVLTGDEATLNLSSLINTSTAFSDQVNKLN